MPVNPTEDWILLSNRLLLLQEIMVGLSQLSFSEVVSRAASGVSWVFEGGVLHNLPPDALSPLPLVTRGRVPLEAFGEVYLAYFPGPPEPRYLLLSGIYLTDPQEFRLAALYFEHMLAALSAAGYREALEREARTDWLTGLGNRRLLTSLLEGSPGDDDAVGLLEFLPADRTQAQTDRLLQLLATALLELLPEGGEALRVGAFRFALCLSGARLSEIQAALERQDTPLVSGWALQRELRAETLEGLFEQAEVRLESALAARWSVPGVQFAPARSPVRVACGSPTLQRAWQERVQAWPIEQEVLLLLDTPHGYALEGLSAARQPVLVVSDSPSEAYLRDLLAQEPQGLMVGTPSDEAILGALGRVLAGERFYEGPALPADDLYPREREVWRLVVRGFSNAQIAAALAISEKTVANYVTNLQDKLFLKNRVELVLFYLGKLTRS